MRVSAMGKRLVAGTFIAAALAVTAPGLAGAAPAQASGSSTVVIKAVGHLLGPSIGRMNPNGPGWDGME